MNNTARSQDRILALATAGLKSDQISNIQNSKSPRVDYLEMKHLIEMDILNYSVYDQTRLGKFLRYFETKLRSDLYLTLMGLFRMSSYPAVFTMSERAGIPFAYLKRFLPRKKAHISMFTSWSWRQEWMISHLNLFSTMDLIVVKSHALKEHFIKLNATCEQIRVILFGIDQHYFAPSRDAVQQKNFVVTAGEIRNRDYVTLFDAIADTPVELLAAASGSWYAREKNLRYAKPTPRNVVLSQRLPSNELKALYTRSQFVVVPLYDTWHSAGATSILEAMSMGRAVIASRSQGILDYVIDGQTGILVTPGDVGEMREAILHLLNHPEEAARLGHNARRRIEEELNMDVYVKKVTDTLRDFLSQR